jgi:Mg-chelatase subunit ChlD
LGPALVASVELASKGAIGSRVIICTDGEANVGIGSGEDVPFYHRVASFAKEKQVGVSVLTIKGNRCNVKMLGKVSLATGGSVMKVDPNNLGSEFSKIISD